MRTQAHDATPSAALHLQTSASGFASLAVVFWSSFCSSRPLWMMARESGRDPTRAGRATNQHFAGHFGERRD